MIRNDAWPFVNNNDHKVKRKGGEKKTPYRLLYVVIAQKLCARYEAIGTPSELTRHALVGYFYDQRTCPGDIQMRLPEN